jgi:hypothetical protein
MQLQYAASPSAPGAKTVRATILLDTLRDGAGPVTAQGLTRCLEERLPDSSMKAVHYRQMPLIASLGVDFPLVGATVAGWQKRQVGPTAVLRFESAGDR